MILNKNFPVFRQNIEKNLKFLVIFKYGGKTSRGALCKCQYEVSFRAQYNQLSVSRQSKCR